MLYLLTYLTSYASGGRFRAVERQVSLSKG